MTSTSPMRFHRVESHVVGTQIHLLDRFLQKATFLLFLGGLALLFAGWLTGNQSIANQNIAVARGLTACGCFVVGGLPFVTAAVIHHRDGAFAENQIIRNHR